MRDSPTAGYLRDLSLHERIMLAAVLKCIKRGETEEIEWGDVSHPFLLAVRTLKPLISIVRSNANISFTQVL